MHTFLLVNAPLADSSLALSSLVWSFFFLSFFKAQLSLDGAHQFQVPPEMLLWSKVQKTVGSLQDFQKYFF